MKQIKNLIILILIIGNSKTGNCGEFASWWQKTPNGNEICNEKWNNNYVIGIKCKDFNVKGNEFGHVVTNLKKWYFYKKLIIGELDNKGFFIFDESTCTKEIFEEKRKFKHRLKELNLNPMIWTRWYKSNWGIIFTSGDITEGIIFFYLKLPCLIIISTIFLTRLIKTKFNFLRHKFNKFILAVIILIIGRILLDILPNSF